MDLVHRLLWLLPLLGACKSLVPTQIVDADPVVIHQYAHPNDTAVAYLLPHPELPNEHFTALIQLARKQRATLFVVRWKHFDEPVQFQQQVFPQRAENQIVDSTSAWTSQRPVIWIVAQTDWVVLGARLAQGLKPRWFIPIDGYWLPLELEWAAAAQQLNRPVWLDSAHSAEFIAHQIDRIQRNPSRDSVWMGRSYHYWNHLMAKGGLTLPTTAPAMWMTSTTHPWMSESSLKNIQAILKHTAFNHAHDQPEFFEKVALWLEEH
jgi:hypothetical protein